MGQRIAFVIAAGMAAFTAVLVGALLSYVVLKGPTGAAASLPQQPAAAPAPNIGGTQGDTQPQQPQDQQQGGSDNSTGYPVSPDQAANIAQNVAPGATLLQQPRLVNVSGTIAYEVKLSQGLVYVDATTGQVLYNGAFGGRRFRRRGP